MCDEVGQMGTHGGRHKCSKGARHLHPRVCDERESGEVAVELAVVGVALEELALDEGLDALLDDGGVGQEARAQLPRHLRHDAVVVQHAPRLHYAHHSRLYLRLSVFLHLRAWAREALHGTSHVSTRVGPRSSRTRASGT